jgi:hypothetical protein
MSSVPRYNLLRKTIWDHLNISWAVSHVHMDRLYEIVAVVVIVQPIPAYRGSRVDVGYIRLIHIFL